MISSEGNNFEKSEKTTDVPIQNSLKNLHVFAKQEKHRPFLPVLGNSFLIKENCSNESDWEIIAYNQRHNMILVKTADTTVSFYNADTLQPLEGRKDLKFCHSLQRFCYSSEIDTYLIVCVKMEIYTYNASTQELEKLKHNVKGSLFSITFINPHLCFCSNGKRNIHKEFGESGHSSFPDKGDSIKIPSDFEKGKVSSFRSD